MGVKEAATAYVDLCAPPVDWVPPGYKQTELGLLPIAWSCPSIESIVDEISMGPFGSDIKVSNFISSGVPVLSGTNVGTERLRDSFENFVSTEKAKSLKKAIARRGDIVVTHRGTIGQISYIPDNSAFDRYVISQSQFRVRFQIKIVIPAWVVLYFHSERGSKKLLEGKGHTGVPAIAAPTKTFRDLCIPLPPVPEQRAIAGALRDADALIESLQQLIAKKRQIKQGAMQAMLTGQQRLPGFSGEWRATRVGELGVFLKGRSVTKAQALSGLLPCVRYGEIYTKHDVLIKTFFSWISTGVAETATRLKNGDLLFAGSGETKAEIGKCVAFVNDAEAYAGGDIIILRSVGADAMFLGYYLNTRSINIQKASKGQGDAVVHIGADALSSIEIRIPERDEQIAIATVLSDMDAEITALETRLAKAREIKQGMMQALLTGAIRLPLAETA